MMAANRYLLSVLLLGLSACGERYELAPVEELNWRDTNTHVKQHIVRRGDTLYAIAFRYDRDYRELAQFNHFSSPYALQVGQVVRLSPSYTNARSVASRPSYYAPALKQTPRYVRPALQRSTPHLPASSGKGAWVWPAHGRVVANFYPNQGKKGLDIAGSKGAKIYAAGTGTVAYAGSGLSGYGNLIIIKHDNQYLTAYGNNARNLVSEGQSIKAGQVIADMGVVDRRFWGVHFEIRQAGKPVNPLNYLHGTP